ncbi:hypothetical protein IAR55_006659 [Kwoniella newhampshirensis]|uniref:SUN domain-containing protein n=1 Tax=Kwoniella newhampshirensis TaxID=1651941 RepID=A0AAW0YUI1_9TREE
MSNNAPPRRAHPNARSTPYFPIPSSASSPAFLSQSTFTFIASWQGQLLVCTVVLVLGAVYFFIREPIDQWRRRRREVLSRLRERELMEMEKERDKEKSKTASSRGEDEWDKDDGGKDAKLSARERGREKRKEVKKRKGSLLPPATTNDVDSPFASSIESSPAPPIANGRSPTHSRRIQLPLSPATVIPCPSSVLNRPRKNAQEDSVRLAAPRSLPASVTVNVATSPIAPWDVPLPTSPSGGPSNTHETADRDVPDNAPLTLEDETDIQVKTKFDGFSIIPEAGYLPVVQTPGGGKKKKRKGKVGGTPSAADKGSSDHSSINGDRRASADPRSGISSDNSTNPSSSPYQLSRSLPTNLPGPRHQRISSITTRLDLSTQQLRDIVEQRDDTIDSLRGEIGLAKAEEAKAREDATRARLIEERLKVDLERLKRVNQKSDADARRREQDLQHRLSQLHQLYTSVIQRLASFEMVLRENGATIPPPASPIPLQFPQSGPVPILPTSPYNASPGRHTPLGGNFIPYPSPGMYPSPMLHLGAYHTNSHGHSHSASPSPFRRSSEARAGGSNGMSPIPHGVHEGDSSSLAGPLTPGLLGEGGLYAMDIGSSTMPIGRGIPPSGDSEEVHSDAHALNALNQRRRFSIESTVLKKKVKEEKGANGESIEEENGTETLITENRTENETDSTGDNHPASPSPISTTIVALRVLEDGARGNVYYSPETGRSIPLQFGISESDETSQANRGVEAVPDLETDTEQSSSLSASINGTTASASSSGDNECETRERGRMMVIAEPIFASLAHTPEQIEEMRRMREAAVRERQRSASLSVGGGGQRKNVGLGMGGLLTPSPSKSPVPLRG